MRKIIIALFLAMSLSACISGLYPSDQNKSINAIAPFPEPFAGYKRHVIHVEKVDKEDDVRIELLVGKELSIDCNTHKMQGSIQKKELVGWGYSYYVVDSDQTLFSTKMACPNGDTRNQFVYISTALGWIRYNSNLPIVVYAPSDLQVKYRFWNVDNTLYSSHIE